MAGPLDELFDALGALEETQGASLQSASLQGASLSSTGVQGAEPGTADHAIPDTNRQGRKGVPEVILADSKRPEQVIAIARHFVTETGRAIISRVGDELLAQLRSEFSELPIDTYSASSMVVIRRPGRETPKTGGKVGVISAGTSDIPVAEQCKVVALEMGCEVMSTYDVGVAGMHRLFRPLKAMIDAEVDVIVVAAGMDGALPSVVAGLVDVPVIGLPTSVGYGIGGKGVSALLSMLQTCSPGLTVVNIDNGVGAGATAALIANRAAKARAAQPRSAS